MRNRSIALGRRGRALVRLPFVFAIGLSFGILLAGIGTAYAADCPPGGYGDCAAAAQNAQNPLVPLAGTTAGVAAGLVGRIAMAGGVTMNFGPAVTGPSGGMPETEEQKRRRQGVGGGALVIGGISTLISLSNPAFTLAWLVWFGGSVALTAGGWAVLNGGIKPKPAPNPLDPIINQAREARDTASRGWGTTGFTPEQLREIGVIYERLTPQQRAEALRQQGIDTQRAFEAWEQYRNTPESQR